MYTLMDYLTQCTIDYRGDSVSHHSTIKDARKRMNQIIQDWCKRSGFTVHEKTHNDVVLVKWSHELMNYRYYHLWIVRNNSELE